MSRSHVAFRSVENAKKCWDGGLLRVTQGSRTFSTAALQHDQEWATAKPFEDIPGPKPLPIVGNYHHFLPGFRKYDFSDLLVAHKQLREEFGPIVKFAGMKPHNDLVFVYEPGEVEHLIRNEGAWPIRPGLRSLTYYRNVTRKDFFQGVGGVLVDQGKKWQEARSQVNPVMMQTKIVSIYANKINNVANDFVNRIPEFRGKDNKLKPEFLNELYKWALESIAQIALDTRLGCLAPGLSPDSEPQRMIDAVNIVFKCLHTLEVKSFMWQLWPTKPWTSFVKSLDLFVEVSMKYIEQAIARSNQSAAESDQSVLGRFLARDPNPKRAVIMVLDMLMAGIDTTSYATSFVLLELANNPEKQERLYKELRSLMPTPDTPITHEMLNEMRYLRACIKETLRMQPITSGNARTTQQDIVLMNYRIPKGVDVVLTSTLMSRQEKHFPNADKFRPERWLRDEVTERPNPFVSLPFGHGARKCVGMRFASLEMETLLAKLLRRYKWEWKEAPMNYKSAILRSPGDPLRFTLSDRVE